MLMLCIGALVHFLVGPFLIHFWVGDCNPYTRNLIKNHEEMPACSKFSMFTGLNCSSLASLDQIYWKNTQKFGIDQTLLMPHILFLFGDNPGGRTWNSTLAHITRILHRHKMTGLNYIQGQQKLEQRLVTWQYFGEIWWNKCGTLRCFTWITAKSMFWDSAAL